MPPEWTVGDRLRKARESRGIKSTKDMASKLTAYFGKPISGSAVGAWERGDNQPGRKGIGLMEVLRAYADLLDYDVEYFTLRSRCFSLLPTSQGQLSMYDDDLEPLDLFGHADLVAVG